MSFNSADIIALLIRSEERVVCSKERIVAPKSPLLSVEHRFAFISRVRRCVVVAMSRRSRCGVGRVLLFVLDSS